MEAILALDNNNGLSKHGLIPWKSQKDRLNIVLTSNPDYFIFKNESSKYENILFTKDMQIYSSILNNREKYLNTYASLSRNFKIYIIGGKQIYETFFLYVKQYG